MEGYNKPPIGVSPAWFEIPNRIKVLSEAISRFTEYENFNRDKEFTNAIRGWAVEIECHCDTLKRLLD